MLFSLTCCGEEKKYPIPLMAGYTQWRKVKYPGSCVAFAFRISVGPRVGNLGFCYFSLLSLFCTFFFSFFLSGLLSWIMGDNICSDPYHGSMTREEIEMKTRARTTIFLVF